MGPENWILLGCSCTLYTHVRTSCMYHLQAPAFTKFSCSGSDSVSQVRPHHTNIARPTLASGFETDHLQGQGSDFDLPRSPWPGSGLYRRLSDALFTCTQSAVCKWTVIDSACLQTSILGRQAFRLRSTITVEWSPTDNSHCSWKPTFLSMHLEMNSSRQY